MLMELVNPAQQASSRLGNPNLKPGPSEFEFGFDSRFFDNRVGITLLIS
jgi:hypothetical protein